METSFFAPQVDLSAALLASTPLSPPVKAHIARVYQILVVFLAAAAVGTATQIRFQLGGILTLIGIIATTFWFVLTPYNGINETKKKAVLKRQ